MEIGGLSPVGMDFRGPGRAARMPTPGLDQISWPMIHGSEFGIPISSPIQLIHCQPVISIPKSSNFQVKFQFCQKLNSTVKTVISGEISAYAASYVEQGSKLYRTVYKSILYSNMGRR